MKTEILVYIESAISRYIREESDLSFSERVHLQCCMNELLSTLFNDNSERKIGSELYDELSKLDTNCYFVEIDNFIERLHNV